jgi:hypothetical protein
MWQSDRGYGCDVMPATRTFGMGRSGERELLDRLLGTACAGQSAVHDGRASELGAASVLPFVRPLVCAFEVRL